MCRFDETAKNINLNLFNLNLDAFMLIPIYKFTLLLARFTITPTPMVN